MEHWTVLKFGGTSVARPAHWETIARLAGQHADAGHRVVLVCSALAGVTDALSDLTEGDGDPEPGVERILEQHAALARDLGIDFSDGLANGRRRLHEALTHYRSTRRAPELAQFMALGEELSSRLGQRFLAGSLDTGWVDARTALTTVPETQPDSKRAWLSARCLAEANAGLQRDWARLPPVLITQGFVASAPGGETALLGRGGSDTSAALLAAALQAPAVEIWTDVPGLFTADPRLEPDALLIRELDYAEALELAASGARVVHPRAIRAAADAGVTMLIRDIGRPALEGTRISSARSRLPDGIKAVTCQPGMLVLLLENLDTRQQVGFLAWVFGVISDAGVSVDLVATSETTTTLAINASANHLDAATCQALESALSARCRVQLFEGCSCVNLVGRGARKALSRIGGAARIFEQRPLLMLSQSANDLSISLLVHGEDAPALVAGLHSELIGQHAGALGPTWGALKAGT